MDSNNRNIQYHSKDESTFYWYINYEIDSFFSPELYHQNYQNYNIKPNSPINSSSCIGEEFSTLSHDL